MRSFIFFLVLTATYFQAQNTENKEAFKKCQKAFSKKICLSDEDRDGIPFYLDACPKQLGSNQNKGCPVKVIPHKDTTEVAELGDVIILGFRRSPPRGCGQIIHADSLKLKPKTK